ncbi:hypothetical protein F0Q45_00350 [Mycobacterium simiae]|uniref:Uncharacterized protein n=1 Tax=Mycobacterium simiae TaxID=1784 RepID=A0A5B1BWP8_MYCSI|nr:hypothetical protein [Mycobacterium simiae]KAA1252175.1 hypothetical protein F0Q45_00350 [Mycobacterium simiae]
MSTIGPRRRRVAEVADTADIAEGKARSVRQWSFQLLWGLHQRLGGRRSALGQREDIALGGPAIHELAGEVEHGGVALEFGGPVADGVPPPQAT